MSAATCPRLFEVEALRDGRLAGVERSSFERHLTSCAVCSREAQALDTLGQKLSTSSPANIDELHLRRERTRLLAAFDRSQVGPSVPRLEKRPLVAFSLSLALALVVGAFILWRPKPNAEVATATDTAIHADGGARWSRHTRDGRELVVLQQGSLWIRVRQAPGAPAFAVLLPDGELEDIGTTFSVAVTDGRTERVQVEEGTVLLKLRGRPPLVLKAGQTWEASPAPAPPPIRVPAGSVAPSEPAPSQQPASPPPANPAGAPVHAGPAPRASSTAPAGSSEPSPSRDASDEFRTALAAFNAGQTRDAARQFRSFAEQHPADPRAEDAAYLRVLALERAGDIAGRRAAARVYLRRYPAGFRRAEVERLGR
jgi:hypothetical protein